MGLSCARFGKASFQQSSCRAWFLPAGHTCDVLGGLSPRRERARQLHGAIGRGRPRLRMAPATAPARQEHPRSAFKSSGSPDRGALRTPLRQVRRNAPSLPAAGPDSAAACSGGALPQGSTPHMMCSDPAAPECEASERQPAQHASPALHRRGSTDSDISLRSLARNARQVLASLADGVRHKLRMVRREHLYHKMQHLHSLCSK